MTLNKLCTFPFFQCFFVESEKIICFRLKVQLGISEQKYTIESTKSFIKMKLNMILLYTVMQVYLFIKRNSPLAICTFIIIILIFFYQQNICT